MYIYNFQHLLIRAEVIMLLFEGWYSGVAGYAPIRLSAYGISDTPKLKISMTHLMRLHRGQTWIRFVITRYEATIRCVFDILNKEHTERSVGVRG